ncbi:MAG TPA: metalloregulator ArsR/SmtB family transcription factor [Acidimicrobiales bacterium]|nr:metalloregulator ArsR/SmtB family transcription factor [Acidimicrobiales bacterium]
MAPADPPSASSRDTDGVFAALADPTRRQLLDQLATEGPLTATALAEHYPMSRQAVAKHITALAGAGLVVGERSGREVRYRVAGPGLGDAASWLADVETRWDRRLDALQRRFKQ